MEMPKFDDGESSTVSGKSRKEIERLARRFCTEKGRGELAPDGVIRLSAEDLALLVQVLSRRWRRQRWLSRFAMAAFYGSIFCGNGKVQSIFGSDVVIAACVFLLVSFILTGLSVIPSARMRGAADALAHIRDPRAIGPLLDIEAASDARNPDVARALVRLLPRLSDAEWRRLSARRRGCMERILARDMGAARRPVVFKALHHGLTDSAVALKVVILETIARLGDKASLPGFEKLADLVGANAKECEVVRAAGEWLPVLSQRVEREEAARTLLRPAGRAAPDELLRAAEAGVGVPTEQLLRARSQDQT